MICRIISIRVESSEQVVFDSGGSIVIVDISTNAHICLGGDIFNDNIEPIPYNVVATIGEKSLIPKGIGTVSWSWTDDEEQLYTNKLNNLIYFKESPVNILSENSLDEFMKVDEVTWVLTKRKYSLFTLYFGNYKKTIAHSENCLT